MTTAQKIRQCWFDTKQISDVSFAESVYRWTDVNRDVEGWNEGLGEHLGTRILEEHNRDANNLSHPPFYDESREYAILVFPNIVIDDATLDFQVSPICSFLRDQEVLTIGSDVQDITDSVRRGIESGNQQVPRTSVELMIRLLTYSADQFLLLIPVAQVEIDEFRSRIMDPRDRVHDWTRLYFRRATYRQLRSLARQFESAIVGWRNNTDFPTDDRTTSRFNNLMEHLQRAINELRENESEVDSLVELHFASTAHQTNETVRILTVLSSIFLPLTFLAGIFGMNFAVMPELQLSYGYPLALGAMLAIALVLGAFFKKKGWF